MLQLALLIGGLVAIVASLNLRRGLYLTTLVGMLQDPIRKIVPGQPVYLEGLVIVVLAATFLGAKARGIRLLSGPLDHCRRAVSKPLNVFLLVVFVGVLITLVRTANGMVAGIGLIAYLAPLPAILVGYHGMQTPRDLDRFARFYAFAAAAMLAGVYCFQFGFRWKLLTPVGEWLDVYNELGAVRLLPGFFRGSEIAAWHGTCAICLLMIRAVSARRGLSKNIAAVVLIPYLLMAVILTGRRKALAELFLFVVIYGVMLYRSQRGSTRVLRIGLAVVIAGIVIVKLGIADTVLSTGGAAYLERMKTVTRDATERASLFFDTFYYAYERNGFFGSGTGVGSPGSQHYGAGVGVVGGSAESGPTKIVAELGIPGFATVVWLVYLLAKYIWRSTKVAARLDPLRARMMYGLVAFLAANAGVFFTAHQIFGDPLVLIMLGWSLGFMLALLKTLAVRPAAAPVPAPAPVRREQPALGAALS